jgi:hypothetical protein
MKRKPLSHCDFFPRYVPGKFSKVAQSFDQLTPQDRVFLILRVSHRERKKNLKDQDANLRAVVNSVGAKIVGKVAKSMSGFDPLWLFHATEKAKKLGATVLLAETPDRFIRLPSFHCYDGRRKEFQATDEQLAELVEATQGMRLMTHIHPDATPKECRSYQRKRGRRFKSKKGGQPSPGYKKRRKEEKKSLVLFLHRQGWSIRRIAAKGMVSVPKSTVARWIKNAG